MRARLAYPLLFLVPSATLALVAGVVAGGAGAGVLWLFVYGDDPWPASAEWVVMGLVTVVAVMTLAMLLAGAWWAGKRREAAGGVARRHVGWAIGLSIGLPLLVLLRQWQIGLL